MSCTVSVRNLQGRSFRYPQWYVSCVLYPWTSHGFNLTALRSWINELVALLFGLTDRNCVKALQEKRKDTRDTKARISRRAYIGDEKEKRILWEICEKLFNFLRWRKYEIFLSWLMPSPRLYLLVMLFSNLLDCILDIHIIV